MKILIIKQTALGDVIHSTLAIEAIRKQYPDAELHFMVDRVCALAVESNPHIDKFFYFDKVSYGKRLKKSWLEFFPLCREVGKILRELRQTKYDLAFDLQGIERSIFFLYLCRAKRKFVKGNKPLLKGFKNASKNDHALTEIRGTLKLGGIECEEFFPKIYLKKSADFSNKLPAAIQQALGQEDKKLILLSPFTSWVTKDFPVEAYLRTVELLRETHADAEFAFVATPDKRDEINTSIKEFSFIEPNTSKHVHNLAGLTNIQELQVLIDQANLVIASEGAVGHIASALDTPVCVIFGPTQPTRVGPWGKNAYVIQSETASCLACYKRKCDKWICMDGLEPQICEKSLELLD